MDHLAYAKQNCPVIKYYCTSFSVLGTYVSGRLCQKKQNILRWNNYLSKGEKITRERIGMLAAFKAVHRKALKEMLNALMLLVVILTCLYTKQVEW